MTAVRTPSAVDARTRHFGVFYGLDAPVGDGPVALVVGNCQAESLRIMLDAGDLRTVRMPAVHELTSDDIPHLDRWLGEATILVSQPVRDDYHSLPVGTGQMSRRLKPGGRTVVVPVVRFAGLYPAHAIIRPPADPGATPPLVEYHDLRLLVEASGEPQLPAITPERVRAIAELSLGELRRREEAHGSVPLSDLFAQPSFGQMRTLNHPGNPIWAAAALRVRDRLGLEPVVVDPGRPLLDSIHAPREAVVIETWGLGDEPTDHWTVGGAPIPDAQVREAHLRWYAENPDVVAAGLLRHAEALQVLSA